MDGISYRVNLLNGGEAVGSGGGSAVEVRDEGISLGKVTEINFVGADVRAQRTATGKVTVFVPVPVLSSLFNTQSGSTDARVPVVATLPRRLGRGVLSGDWNPPLASSGGNLNGQTIRNATNVRGPWALATNGPFSIPQKDTRLVAQVFDETNLQLSRVVLNLDANGTGVGPGLSMTVENYQSEAFQWRATMRASVDALVYGIRSRRYRLRIVHEKTQTGEQIGLFEQVLFLDIDSPKVSMGQSALSLQTAVLKNVSGVRFLTLGTLFKIVVPNLDNTATDTFPPDAGLVYLEGPQLGLTDRQLDGPDLQNWSNVAGLRGASYTAQDWQVVAPNLFFRGLRNTQNKVRDYAWSPWGPSNSLNVLLDTYADNASGAREEFRGESRRTKLDGTSWDPAESLVTIDGGQGLQVIGGTLRRPLLLDFGQYLPPAGQPNYSGLSAGDKTFIRPYNPPGSSTKSNGVFYLPGLTDAQVSGGKIKLEISLDRATWFNCLLPYNPGAGPLQAGFGCRVEPGEFSPGRNQSLKFTLGTSFTNKLWVRVTLPTGSDVVLEALTLTNWL